jgi:hypothetical protein
MCGGPTHHLSLFVFAHHPVLSSRTAICSAVMCSVLDGNWMHYALSSSLLPPLPPVATQGCTLLPSNPGVADAHHCSMHGVMYMSTRRQAILFFVQVHHTTHPFFQVPYTIYPW